jgi:L-fuculose-phosphate aldolase
MICFHDNLDKALWLGVEIETLAKQYWHACQAGDPVILSPAQMDEVLVQFQGYGKQPTAAQ